MGINNIVGNRRRVLQYYNTITDTSTGNGIVEFQSARRCPVKSAVFFGDCIQAGVPSVDDPQPIIANNCRWVVNGNDLWDKTKVDRVTAVNILPGYTSTTEYFEGQGDEGTRSLSWSTGSISIYKSDTYVIPAGSYIVSIDITLLEVGKYDDRISIMTYGADSKHDTIITTLKKGITNRVYITINNTNYDIQHINMYLNNNKVRVAWDTLRIYAANSQTVNLSWMPLYSVGNVRDEFDSATGKLTNRCARIASYNGQDVGDVWISSTGALTTGAEVVYVRSVPKVSYITPQPVVQRAGNNTLQQVSGDINNTRADITYYSYGTHNINN